MKVIYDNTITHILNTIGCKISINLLKKKETLIHEDIHQIGISDKIGYVTVNFPYKNSKKENILKIGRLIVKLNLQYTSSEIEVFTNKFKAAIKEHINLDYYSSNLEIVSGEDIRKWYLVDNYKHDDSSTLSKSCMKHHMCQEFLDIYVNNPNSCRMLILKENEKLIARALLWKVKSNKNKTTKNKFEYILDKIYSSNTYDEYVIKKWAMKNNWAIRISNEQYIYNNQVHFDNLVVKVIPKKYKYYPYMDTFTRYDYIKGHLYNDYEDKKFGHILNETLGEYKKSISRLRSVYYTFNNFCEKIGFR
jgi:hypothetical protein